MARRRLVLSAVAVLAAACASKTVDRPPIANAGGDQLAFLGDPVTLDGSASSDPDPNDAITFEWRALSVPSNGGIAAGAVVGQQPTLTLGTAKLSAVGSYVFSLTVTDPKGLTASDVAGVEVKDSLHASILPNGDSATQIAGRTPIVAVFSAPIRPWTTGGSIEVDDLTDPTDVVNGDLSLDLGGTAIVFTPVADWIAGHSYQATLTTAPIGLDGAPLRAPVTQPLVAAATDGIAPSVIAVSPSGAGQPLGSVVRWLFSEPMDPTSIVTTGFHLQDGSGTDVPGVVVLSSSGVMATFIPGAAGTPSVPQALQPATSYTVLIDAGAISDLGHNPLPSEQGGFSTIASADTTPPSVVSISPIRGANGISVKLPTMVTFSEPVDPSTVSTASMTLGTAAGAAVAGSVYLTMGNTVAVFQPAANLSTQTTYDVALAGTIADLSGNTLSPFASFYRTGASPPPTVDLVSPSSAPRGSQSVIADVIGEDFTDGAGLTAFFSGGNSNVNVSSIQYQSPTQLLITFDVSQQALPGARTLTVRNPDGQDGSKFSAFTVLDYAPTIASVTPPAGDLGQMVTLDVLGANFRPGTTLSVSGSDVAVGATTVVSGGELRATLTISAGAVPGPRDVVVTEADGQVATATGAFTIRLPAPVVTSISPRSGGQSSQIAGLLVLGTNFQTSPSLPTVAMGSGVLASTVTATATQITLNVTIAGNATLGSNDVVVTNADGQSTTLVKGFVVQRAPPTVSSASPAISRQSTATLTVAGNSFDCSGNGPTLIVGNGGTPATGVTVNNAGAPVSCSTTQVARSVTVAATATAPALQDVRVTNPDNQFGDAPNAVSIRLEAPTFASTSPASVRIGDTQTVTINGNFFQSSPSLPTVAFGGGALSTVSAATATSITTTVSIPSSGTTTGSFPVVITNADGQQVTGSYTIAAPNPTVSGVTPNPVDRGGAAQPITVTGANFQCPVSFAFTPSTGITVGAQTACSTTSVTRSVTFASPATAAGSYAVTVTNADGGVGTLANALTVRLEAPTFTSTTPGSVRIGTSATVTINGTFFQTSPFPTVAFGGGALSSVTAATTTTITATVSVPSGATTGTFPVVITNADGQQVSGTYTITPPNPTIGSVTPATVDRGGPAQSITVNGTDFQCPATFAFSPSAGITVGAQTACSATSVTRSVTFASPGTAPGSYAVTLTNADAGVSNTLSNALTVKLEAPTISTLSPNVSGREGTTISTTINGTFFQASPSVSFGAGIAVSVGTVTSTTIQVTLTIDPAAGTGTRDVTVTNADGQAATKTAGFNVQLPNPVLTDLNPNFGSRGSTVTGVLLDGQFFQCNATTPSVTINDAHVTIANVTCNSGSTSAETQLKADFNLTSALSTVGPKNVTVTNADGGAVTLNGAFTEKAEPPQVSTFSVVQGRRGQSLSITVTGSFFQNGATATFPGGGIGVASTSFVDSSHLTVNLSIDPNASRSPATRTITVTNPDGQFNASSPTFTILRALPTVAGTSPTLSAPRQAPTLLGLPINGNDFDCSGAAPAVVFNKSDGTPDAGITVANVTCQGSTSDQATQLKADVTLGATSTTGLKSITVTNPTVGGDSTDVGTSGLVFTEQAETPLLTSVSPAVAQGATTSVTVLGRYFQNTPSLPVVSEPTGTDYTVNSVTFVNSSDLTVSVSVPLTTAINTYGVKVQNADGQSVTGSLFQVVTAPQPTLSSVTPGKGAQGQAVAVSIAGANLQSGATVALSCGGCTGTVTASGYDYTNVPNAIGVTLTISGGASAATIGGWDVTLTNPVGTTPTSAPLVGGFHVTGPSPKVTSVSPSTGSQGASIPTLLVLGSNFRASPALSFAPADITVNSVTLLNGTALNASITIGASAATSPHDVTVTNADTSTGTLSGGFLVNGSGTGPSVSTILKMPTRTVLNPACNPVNDTVNNKCDIGSSEDNRNSQKEGWVSLRDGESGRFEITGANFQPGAIVSISGAGVTSSNATFVSSSRVDVTLKVDAGCSQAGSGGVATGLRDLSVTNPAPPSGNGEAGTLANAFLVRNGVVINEVVTQPTKNHLFKSNNQEVELFNGSQCTFNITGWRLDFTDGAQNQASYTIGSFATDERVGSSRGAFSPGSYWAIANPESPSQSASSPTMGNSVFVLLTSNTGRFLDKVEISANGQDPELDGSTTDGAPDGTGTGGASGPGFESVGRSPNGNDTDADIVDFYKHETTGVGMGSTTTDVTDRNGAATNANNCQGTNCPACSDGIDNDADGWIDALDPGCYTAGVYDPNKNSEAGGTGGTCNDGLDNNADGLKDAADPKCLDGFGTEN